MSARSDIVYAYDGTYDGFLCCVFESYARREIPLHILNPDTTQALLYEIREIDTDAEKARRVAAAIHKKIGSDAMSLLNLCFLSILEERERHMLVFIRLGLKAGARVMGMLTDDRVAVLLQAAGHLNREAHRFLEFIRFSEAKGALVSTIAPKNRVLPLLARHFSDRFPDEYIMIYDETHRQALLLGGDQQQIVELESFTLPQADPGEARYRELWQRFYDTIAIESRANPRCRMNMMPKWYWKNMTEFAARHKSQGVLGGGTGALLPNGTEMEKR